MKKLHAIAVFSFVYAANSLLCGMDAFGLDEEETALQSVGKIEGLADTGLCQTDYKKKYPQASDHAAVEYCLNKHKPSGQRRRP